MLLFVIATKILKKLAVGVSGALYCVLKAVAPLNISVKSETLLTSQLRISLLNTAAKLNILLILVTEDTSQLPIS